ncbi:MAG: hypothetical protein EAX81_06035 [Candidatus Thorarchaeota archaeon]|nr:hypothetical protein [Candidatus Thorarchaeota archaeon]
MTHWKNGLGVWCYGLLWQYEKTEKCKKWHEEVVEKSAEMEAFRYRTTEKHGIAHCIYAYLERLAD